MRGKCRARGQISFDWILTIIVLILLIQALGGFADEIGLGQEKVAKTSHLRLIADKELQSRKLETILSDGEYMVAGRENMEANGSKEKIIVMNGDLTVERSW